jgi:hypothetical protein
MSAEGQTKAVFDLLMKAPSLVIAVVSFLNGLAAAQTVETWVTSKGAMFEASVQKVVPGTVVFVLKDGREQAVAVSELSDRSRVKVVELLGLGSLQVAAVAAPAEAGGQVATPGMAPAGGAPATVPSGPAMAVQAVDGAAVDLTDAAMVQSLVGKEATVVGTVSKVVVLGASGHRLVEFEGSNFNLFVSKQQIEQSSDWVLDDLPGKRLQVKGMVETYRDKPQIRGTDPAQITRVQ